MNGRTLSLVSRTISSIHHSGAIKVVIYNYGPILYSKLLVIFWCKNHCYDVTIKSYDNCQGLNSIGEYGTTDDSYRI